MAVGFVGAEGDVGPDARGAIEGLGVEFPHVGLIGVGDGVFLTKVFEQGF